MPSPVNYFIAHGTHGTPEENWFPWLAGELRKSGRVFVPQFPTPEGQSLAAWLAVADRALTGIPPGDTVLIGHSTGAALVLRMAGKTRMPYKAVFCACPFAGDLGLAAFDPLNASFMCPAFDWKAVKNGAGAFFCFAGSDDPYVPPARSREVAEALDAELIVVEKGGHLNAKAGYRQFPALLAKICEVVS